MSRTQTITYHTLPGTRAGIARAGGTIVIADRRARTAGGEGVGANGAQLLAAAIGGCFWNDLHAIADRLGQPAPDAQVTVELAVAGTPPRVVRATVTARLPAAAREIFDAAETETIIGNSLMPAFPVAFSFEELP